MVDQAMDRLEVSFPDRMGIGQQLQIFFHVQEDRGFFERELQLIPVQELKYDDVIASRTNLFQPLDDFLLFVQEV